MAGVAHAFGVATDARGRHLLTFCLCVGVSGGGAAHPGVADVDQVAGAQQGAAHGGVGPATLLQAAYIYGAPGLTGSERRGENFDRILAYAAGGEGVHGQILRVDKVEELLGTGAAHLLVESVGGFEEADHGVEVAVGGVGFRSRAARLGDPGFFEAAGFPERPEHLGAGGVGSGEGLAARREHGCDAVHGAPHALFGEGFGVQQCAEEQVVAGAVAAGLQFDGSQLLAESSHVHAGCAAQP